MATSLTFRELANPNTSLPDINAWKVFEVMGGFSCLVKERVPKLVYLEIKSMGFVYHNSEISNCMSVVICSIE